MANIAIPYLNSKPLLPVAKSIVPVNMGIKLVRFDGQDILDAVYKVLTWIQRRVLKSLIIDDM